MVGTRCIASAQVKFLESIESFGRDTSRPYTSPPFNIASLSIPPMEIIIISGHLE